MDECRFVCTYNGLHVYTKYIRRMGVLWEFQDPAQGCNDDAKYVYVYVCVFLYFIFMFIDFSSSTSI